MAQLSWGKPTIEFKQCKAGAVWTTLNCDPVENSTKLTPTKGEKKEAKVEDDTCEGILIERSVVSLEESFDTAEGKKWKYTVDVLKPTDGIQVKAYTKSVSA